MMDAAALELRRRRNRESMQRSRQREREAVEGMRRDIRVLERQYREALQQAAQSIRSGEDEGEEQSNQQQQQPGPPSPSKTREGDATRFGEYQQLARVSKALQHENFRLNKLLDEKRKAYERMERILADYHEQKTDVPDVPEDPNDAEQPRHTDSVVDPNVRTAYAPGKAFSGISDPEAAGFIMKWMRDVRQFELARTPAMPPLSECFGWTLKQAVFQETRIYWMLTKRVASVTARTAAENAWVKYRSLEANNVAKPMRVLRFEVLQTVNENTHVVLRDMESPLHPGVVMRSMMLRFRMETDTGGFVVGRANMFPALSGSRKDARIISSGPVVVRRADMSTWLEFEPLDPADPEHSGCLTKFAGYSDYGTAFDLSERLVAILLFAINVENRVLGAPTPLILG